MKEEPIRVAEGYAIPGPEVSCMDAAEMLVDGFIKDAQLWPDPEDRNELVRRVGLLLSMQRETLKREYDKLKSVVETLSGCLPPKIFVYGAYGENWTDFEAKAGDEYETIDFKEILGEE